MRTVTLVLFLLGFLSPRHARAVDAPARRPNIVYILADDLGYGDVKSLNPEGKILTPNMDLLAKEGMRFTDAHSSSAVCTPTRYGILTGRYNWRSRLKSGVQGGMSPDLIEPGRLTVPAFLKQHGYHTACIGKWHLGFDWKRHPGAAPFGDNIEKGEEGWRADFSKPFGGGPLAVGFDTFFGIAASLDMVPYTFLENDRVLEIPTVEKSFPMTADKMKSGHTRMGPAAAGFEAENVLPELTKRAVGYIQSRAQTATKGNPFFLYLPLNSPHTPIVPSPEWKGKSGISPYADFVMQTDGALGAVLGALNDAGLAEDTLVVMTSDNGCAPQADFAELAAHGHNPSFTFRGTKADIFDGGHHIPFIARWPAKVQPGSIYTGMVCLNDLFATVAEILDKPLPKEAAEDSVSILPALLGKTVAPIRKTLIHHSANGTFAIRQGSWKLILGSDSGGWSAPKPNTPESQTLPAVQLYNMKDEGDEVRNRQAEEPGVVARMTRQLLKEISNGSTAGAPSIP
ncbi:MAG: Arylsulfatase A [Verrucomicrobia bacterium]|nr:MAG: Arylsulfatase A [Verrucomicrobiota bacterium]